jgi:hypothetical protein
MAWLAPVEGLSSAGSTCRRIPVAPGVEVLIDEQHPALRLNGDTAVIAEALRQALASVVGLEPPSPPPIGPQDVAPAAWSSAPTESEIFGESTLGSEQPG